MAQRKTVLLPNAARLLAGLGENIRLARKRRKLTEMQVSERAGIARSTLQSIEKGETGVSMSSYLQVLYVLGLESDLSNIAANDPLGRKLQDAGLVNKNKI